MIDISVDFELLFEYTDALRKHPVDLLFIVKSIELNNSTCLVLDCRLSAVVDDFDFLKLPSEARLFPSKPPSARYRIILFLEKGEIKKEIVYVLYILTLLLSFNASIISLPFTLFKEDAKVFGKGTFLLLVPLLLLLEYELMDDDLRLNIERKTK